MAESIVCVGCGATIPVLDDDPNWSVRTEIIGGVERIVERHLSLLCPMCGISETPVHYEPVNPLMPAGFPMTPRRDELGEPLRFFNLVVETVDPPRPFEAP